MKKEKISKVNELANKIITLLQKESYFVSENAIILAQKLLKHQSIVN
jgi:hypothetical protein